MKKLDNKGFAISTILYGLLVVMILLTSLLMGTMSFSRKNSKNFTDDIRNNLEKNISIIPLSISSSVKLIDNIDNKCYAGEDCNYQITLKVMGKNITKNDISVAYNVCKDNVAIDYKGIFSINEISTGENYKEYTINYKFNSSTTTSNVGKNLSIELLSRVFTNDKNSFNDSYIINLGNIESSKDITYKCSQFVASPNGDKITATCIFTKNFGNSYVKGSVIPETTMPLGSMMFSGKSYINTRYISDKENEKKVEFKFCAYSDCNNISGNYFKNSLPPYSANSGINILLPANSSFENKTEILIDTGYKICSDFNSCPYLFHK